MGNNRTILIVDDEKINLELLAKFLNSLGYRIISVQESTEVFDRVKEMQPDLIIMDIMMPGVSGDKIAARLKSSPATRNIPIILITADILADESKVNADFFIRRPVMGDKLIKILDKVFKRNNLEH